MDLMNHCYTPGDRECRGTKRIEDEAVERVRKAYTEAIAKPVTVRIIVRVEEAEIERHGFPVGHVD